MPCWCGYRQGTWSRNNGGTLLTSLLSLDHVQSACLYNPRLTLRDGNTQSILDSFTLINNPNSSSQTWAQAILVGQSLSPDSPSTTTDCVKMRIRTKQDTCAQVQVMALYMCAYLWHVWLKIHKLTVLRKSTMLLILKKFLPRSSFFPKQWKWLYN